MNIASALAAAYDRQHDAAYEPLVFDNVSAADEAAIRAAFAQHVPEKVDSAFNTWYIRGSGAGFYIRRASWDDNWWCESVERVIDLVGRHYVPVSD